MPKLKTNRAAAKRIRKTAKGYKAMPPAAAITSVIRTASASATPRSGGSSLVDKSDVGRLPALLPNH